MKLTWREHVELVMSGQQGYPLVEVVWTDASAFGIEWTETVEINPRTVTTVGYLVSESDEAISVVQMINTEQVGHGMVIPITDIVWWRDLT
jgi:hypothetical protein